MIERFRALFLKSMAAVTFVMMVAPAAASANIYGTKHRTYEIVPTILIVVFLVGAAFFGNRLNQRLVAAAAERRRLAENEDLEQRGQIILRNETRAQNREALLEVPNLPPEATYIENERNDLRNSRRPIIGAMVMFGLASLVLGSILTYTLVGF